MISSTSLQMLSVNCLNAQQEDFIRRYDQAHLLLFVSQTFQGGFQELSCAAVPGCSHGFSNLSSQDESPRHEICICVSQAPLQSALSNLEVPT